jgi:hypothetical protein
MTLLTFVLFQYFTFYQLYSILIGLIKWSCTVQASKLPVRASKLAAFNAGLNFLPQNPRPVCRPRVKLCGHPRTRKNILAASSAVLRLAATRPACNLTRQTKFPPRQRSRPEVVQQLQPFLNFLHNPFSFVLIKPQYLLLYSCNIPN